MGNSGLFEPDVLMSDEWAATFRYGAAMTSEKKLMLAVLKSALQSYQKYAFARTAQELELFNEAAEWIDCDEQTEWFFSFRNICENLAINPGFLRRRLIEWRQDAVRSQPRSCHAAR